MAAHAERLTPHSAGVEVMGYVETGAVLLKVAVYKTGTAVIDLGKHIVYRRIPIRWGGKMATGSSLGVIAAISLASSTLLTISQPMRRVTSTSPTAATVGFRCSTAR